MISRRIFYIGLRWKEFPQDFGIVDRALDPLGDWIRVNGLTWLLSSTYSSKKIYETLLHTTNLADQILVIALDPTDRFGWAPGWIWDWIDSQRQESPRPLADLITRRTEAGAGLIGKTSAAGGIGGQGTFGGAISGEAPGRSRC